MAQRPRNFKWNQHNTHTKAKVIVDYPVTAASATGTDPNRPSNAKSAASYGTELSSRMADFERKSAIRVHVTAVVRIEKDTVDARGGVIRC